MSSYFLFVFKRERDDAGSEEVEDWCSKPGKILLKKEIESVRSPVKPLKTNP